MAIKKQTKSTSLAWRPPLSRLDKNIYKTGIIISAFIPLILELLFTFSFINYTYSEPSVVAVSSVSSMLLHLPFSLYVGISLVTLFYNGKQNNVAIFGSKDIKYGEAPWAENYFPIFYFRKKPVKKKTRKAISKYIQISLWSLGLVIVLCLLPFGFFGRDCLHSDNSISSYNCMNQKDEKIYLPEDYSRLVIRTNYRSLPTTRGKFAGFIGHWEFGIYIYMTDGEYFYFENEDFSSTNQCLNKFIEIKSLFYEDSTSIKGKENIEKIINELHMSDEQADALRELFDA